MVSPEDGGPRSRHDDDETNIFVAFRHLADDYITALVNSTKDFTTFGQQAREHWGDAHEKTKDRFEHCRQKIEEHKQRAHDRTVQEDQMLRKRWQDMTATVDGKLRDVKDNQQKAEESYALWTKQQPDRKAPDQDAQPTSSSITPTFNLDDLFRPLEIGFSIHERSKLPLSYVLRSPYSPLHLQEDPATSKATLDWKVAFEELLEISQGYSIPEQRSKFEGSQSQITNEDWAARLVNRGLVGYHFFSALSGLPHDAWSWPFEHEENAGDKGEAETELDLYERFLGHDASARTRDKVEDSAVRYTQLGSSPHNSESSRPDILSTFTKTESKTLPDGSVVTKTVLKKRFADGSVENNETTSTTPPRIPSKDTRDVDSEATQREVTRQRLEALRRRDKDNKSSWFWS